MDDDAINPGTEAGEQIPGDTGQTGQATENNEPQQTALDVMNEALGYTDDSNVDGQQTPAVGGNPTGEQAQLPVAGQEQQPAGQPPVVSLEELYTEPEGLAPKSSERFKALVEDNRVQRAQGEQREQELNVLRDDVQFMRQTFFTDEASTGDFMQFAGYREALKQGDLESAMGMLQQQAQQLQLLMGRKVDIDPLSAYPDLRQRVDDLSMDEAAAMELARARAIEAQQQQYAQQSAQRQYQQEEQVQRSQQAISQAVEALNQMEAQWAAQDLNYPAKKQKLVELAPQIQRDFPPHLWPRQIELLYQTLGNASAPTATARTMKNAPLRPTGGGGGKPEPATALDALNQALGYND